MPKIISGYISNYGQDKGKRIIQKYWIQQYRESLHSVMMIKRNQGMIQQCVFTLGPDHLFLLINLCINHALPEKHQACVPKDSLVYLEY